GFAAGFLARGAPPDRSIPLTALGLGYVIRRLPEEDRAAFKETAEDLRATITPIRAALAEDRAKLIALLRAETFDKEAARQLLRAQSARISEATIVTGDRVIETLATLSPETRQRFAEAVARPRDRWRRRAESEPPPAANEPPPAAN
ncbi:MAG TPA: periplasmic heavy metal sensor, partial [Paracoccaceae bacterium]|nr:periplasmic heavy metal sensor [Paracoccaceae bacterium]